MNLAAALLLGHLIADFPLQTTTIYALKVKSWNGVLVHALIHVMVTALLVQPFSAAVPLLLMLGILHFFTDYFKVHFPTDRQWPGFLIDQGIHLTVLMVLAYQWQGVIVSVLPFVLLVPLIFYTAFLATLVFLWVLACDLAQGSMGQKPWIQWARQNLLHLSQYAGLPVFISLFQHLFRHTVRT